MRGLEQKRLRHLTLLALTVRTKAGKNWCSTVVPGRDLGPHALSKLGGRPGQKPLYPFFSSLHSAAAFLAALASSAVGYEEVPIMTCWPSSALFEILQLPVFGFFTT
jgi:hypothetical protein